MLAVEVAECDVDVGEFLVLEDVADDARDAKISPDGKLADAVGILVGVRIGPEVLLELLVGAGAGDDAIACNVNATVRVSTVDLRAYHSSKYSI
jgi:hypothetical protein